jgi:hypothetical protein
MHKSLFTLLSSVALVTAVSWTWAYVWLVASSQPLENVFYQLLYTGMWCDVSFSYFALSLCRISASFTSSFTRNLMTVLFYTRVMGSSPNCAASNSQMGLGVIFRKWEQCFCHWALLFWCWHLFQTTMVKSVMTPLLCLAGEIQSHPCHSCDWQSRPTIVQIVVKHPPPTWWLSPHHSSDHYILMLFFVNY